MPYANNERFALAARLHTLLRRKTGRVTDTEWLSVNDDYAAEIVRFARSQLIGADQEDLGRLLDRFEEMLVATAATQRRPKKPVAVPAVSASVRPFVPNVTSTQRLHPQAHATNSDNTVSEDDLSTARYVGSLR